MTLIRKLVFAFTFVSLLVLLLAALALASPGKGALIAAAVLACAGCTGSGWYLAKAVKSQVGGLLQDISYGADQVASAAAQISNASQSLAQGTSEQAASLEETSASTEEINSMARRNSENSHSAADLVKASDQRFGEANRSLQEMVLAMSEINTSSEKISKIIRVIDDIAFQTNILALNAAVEAARAGEAGMGFAVVADEVRNLAQRCAQAARDTAALIEESIEKSNSGQRKVEQVTKAIHTITEQSVQVKTLVDEVHLGSQEQTRGIEQIGKAMVQMERVTQQAAASAEETASAAEQLTAQSSALKDTMGRLAGTLGLDAAVSHKPVRTSTTIAKFSTGAGMKPSLSALHSGVSGSTPRNGASQPVHAGSLSAKTAHEEFPMDGDFTEF